MKYFISLVMIFLFSGCIDKDFLIEPNLTRKAGGTIIALEWWYKNPNIKDSQSFGGSTKDYGASAEQRKDKYIIKWISQFTKEEISTNDLYKVKRSGKFWRRGWTKEKYIENKKKGIELSIEKTLCIDDPRYKEFFIQDEKGKLINKDGRLTLTKEGYFSHTNETRYEFEKRMRNIEIVDDWESDPNQFYYEKDEKGNFIIYDHISNIPSYKEYAVVPVKQCFSDGWCLTYKDYQGKDLYVKKEALYK